MKGFGDMTTDGSIRLNSELYRDILSSDTQPNAAKLMDSALQCRWTMARNYYLVIVVTTKANMMILRHRNGIFISISAFQLLKTGRPTNKQQLKSAAVKA